MRHFYTFLVIPIILFSIISCEDEISNKNIPTINSSDNLITFTSDLHGTNEIPVPDNPSSETGKATLTFDNTSKIFTITVTHSVISPVSGHIYIGESDAVGEPIFSFTTLNSPINYTSVPLTESQEEDLKSNLFYVNIHSEAYPEGEIRGQLIQSTP